jgi:hypothetical protein
MKKHNKRPGRPGPKPASKAPMKAAPAKPAPSLVDVKMLIGQMKGMLTWMSKERTELQNMMAQVSGMIADLSPSDSAGVTADAIPPDSVGTTAETPSSGEHHEEAHDEEHHEERSQESCQEASQEGHGDPVISGVEPHDSEE